MARHKFSVGQIVDFDANARPKFKASGPYEVTRVFPAEDADTQRYQLKSRTEPFHRTANEYEIVEFAERPRIWIVGLLNSQMLQAREARRRLTRLNPDSA